MAAGLASWLLLVALSGCLWHVSISTPVRVRNGPVTETCVIKARALLKNIRRALAMEKMFIGINCSEQKSTLDSGTQTASVCVPENCSGGARAEFDERLCQESIAEDLRFYDTVLSAQPDPLGLLATTVQHAPRELLRSCFPWDLQERPLTSQAPPGSESSFDQRLRLCKVLKGLQARSLTINRALNHLHSEDHRKGPSRKGPSKKSPHRK